MILTDPSVRLVIAHRGASATFPENTGQAFREALCQGADALEFDVRCSADGVPVVIHDPTLDRTTHRRGRVSELTLEEIQRSDAGGGEGVPSLEQVLEAFSSTPLLIEVKEPRAAEPTLAVARRHGAEQRVVIGSFHDDAVTPFRAARIRTAASRRETRHIWMAARLRFLCWRGRYDVVSVPEMAGGLRVVTPRFIRFVKRMGCTVHVWTVDGENDAVRLWEWGVNGVITNRPEAMKRILNEYRISNTEQGMSK